MLTGGERRPLPPSDEGKTLPSGERCLSEGQTERGEEVAFAEQMTEGENWWQTSDIVSPPVSFADSVLVRGGRGR